MYPEISIPSKIAKGLGDFKECIYVRRLFFGLKGI
jgi:hypothetical protein